MPNPFDQFDEPRKSRSNPFDQFDNRTPEQTEQKRVQRLDEVPEIGESSGLLSDQPNSVIASIAALLPVTTDPAEMAKIITRQTKGQVGTSMSPEGRLIARNNKTGAVAELNKPGASWMDAAQALGIGSAFFPSGAGLVGTGAKTLGTLAARSAATQGGIELAQTAGGGDLPSMQNIALEAAVAPGAQIVGEKVIKPALSAGARSVSAAFGRRADDATRTAADLRQGFQSADGTPEAFVETFKGAKPQTIAEMADVDPKFYKAVDELGISSEPLASFGSRSSQFRDVEQALASQVGSRLDDQGRKFVSEVSQKADDLINEYGGTTAKGTLSTTFRQESEEMISKMAEQTDVVYGELDKLMPANTRIEANATLKFINSQANKLGGVDNLSPMMRKLFNDLSPKAGKSANKFSYATGVNSIAGETITPTNELLAARRKEVGQALQGKRSRFQSEEQGLLKALYARLATDQENAAINFGAEGASDLAKAGKALVVQRKKLEENLVNLLGNDLGRPVVNEIGAAVKGLGQKGSLDNFIKKVNQVDPRFRKQVLVSSLNDIFKGSGLDQEKLSTNGFAKFMDVLERDPGAKGALYSQLPKGLGKALDNLHTVSKGIATAKGQKTNTGRILGVFDKSGLISKLMKGTAAKVAGGAVGMAGGGLTGAGVASQGVQEFLSQVSKKSKTSADLLASPDFQRMIRISVREGSVEGGQISRQLKASEQELVKSETFKRWAKSINDSELSKQLLNGQRSAAAYLFSNDGEE